MTGFQGSFANPLRLMYKRPLLRLNAAVATATAVVVVVPPVVAIRLGQPAHNGKWSPCVCPTSEPPQAAQRP